MSTPATADPAAAAARSRASVWPALVAAGLVVSLGAAVVGARHASPSEVSPVSPAHQPWHAMWTWGVVAAFVLYVAGTWLARGGAFSMRAAVAVAIVVQAMALAAPLLLSKDVYLLLDRGAHRDRPPREPVHSDAVGLSRRSGPRVRLRDLAHGDAAVRADVGSAQRRSRRGCRIVRKARGARLPRARRARGAGRTARRRAPNPQPGGGRTARVEPRRRAPLRRRRPQRRVDDGAARLRRRRSRRGGRRRRLERRLGLQAGSRRALAAAPRRPAIPCAAPLVARARRCGAARRRALHGRVRNALDRRARPRARIRAPRSAASIG